MSTPIDWKLGRWYKDAIKIHTMYLHKEKEINFIVQSDKEKSNKIRIPRL